MSLFNNSIDLSMVNLTKPSYNKTRNAFVSKFAIKNTPISTPYFKIQQIDNDHNHMIVEFININESNDFYNSIISLDKFMIKYISAHGHRLFNLDIDTMAIEDLYKSSINIPTNIASLPTMRIHTNTSTVLANGTKDQMKPGTVIKLDLNIDGICFEKNKCFILYNAITVQSSQSFGHDDILSEINDVTMSVMY